MSAYFFSESSYIVERGDNFVNFVNQFIIIVCSPT